MNIAIVDDVWEDRERLANHIKSYARENSLMLGLWEYGSGESFLESRVHQLDAVFLDIFLDGINGMEVARILRETEPSCRIIFVTTSEAFAVQSYSVQAFYYILKPFVQKEISRVLELLNKSLTRSSHYIKVKEGRQWCMVPITDIIYTDYSNHYILIHTQERIISTHMKFTDFEAMLASHSDFLCCYRCIIVNMRKIKKVDNLFFVMCTDEYVPINRNRAKEIKTHYTDFVFATLEEDLPSGC